MNLIKKEEKDNKLLGRKEFLYEVETDGHTSKKQDVLEEIAKTEKIDSNRVVVVKISQVFGKTICYATAYVYDSKESVLKKIKHEKGPKPGKKKEKPAAEEEKPKEEESKKEEESSKSSESQKKEE
ncbi:MAG: hypothetical protein DRN66_00930 [Candidatus Nanohalarchaeota archaeon]|nr:MAG: hypothetical protein DRN66_00930 [Candidatus Nanohaloarchaeota archaeon]